MREGRVCSHVSRYRTVSSTKRNRKIVRKKKKRSDYVVAAKTKGYDKIFKQYAWYILELAKEKKKKRMLLLTFAKGFEVK